MTETMAGDRGMTPAEERGGEDPPAKEDEGGAGVDEQGEQSFPASDPPAHSGTT